jgi:hypothetical protein
MMLKRHLFPIGLFASLIGVATSGAAHDLKGLLVQEPKSASPQIASALAATPSSDLATRSVINNLRLWPVPRKLTVCFLSGSPQLRKRVSAAMLKAWPLGNLTGGRLEFDSASFATVPTCSANPTADIRIDFKPNDGYWSYVGVESLNNVPSMNLAGFTETSPAQKEFERLVGHETGHAIGLEHEHQSPDAPDCGWNFPYIFSHYQWASEQDMHNNFDKLHDYIYQNVHAYIFSTYDQKSEMHYDFEPEAFTNGSNSPCFITRNYVPSDQDKNAIRVAYGPSLVTEQAAVRSAAPELQNSFSGAHYDKLRQLLELKSTLLK